MYFDDYWVDYWNWCQANSVSFWNWFTYFLNLFQNKTIRRIQQKSPRGAPTVSDRREIIRGFSFKFFTYPKTYTPFCCYFCWLFFFPAVLLLQTLKGNDKVQRDKLAAITLLHSSLNFYCYPGCLFHSAKYCWILYIKLVVLCYDTWFSITLSLSALEKKRKEIERSEFMSTIKKINSSRIKL